MGSILPTFHSPGKVPCCRTCFHHSFPRSLYHQRLEEDWYRCGIDSEFLMSMTHCRETRVSMQTISRPLDMDCRCIIACFYLVQHTALHQRPVEDWYKFLNGLARHLHTLKNKCPSFPKLSIYRPPDNGSHCRIEPLCWVLRSLRHHVLEEDWCMIWIVPVAHHHN